jgi:hypothetical protein
VGAYYFSREYLMATRHRLNTEEPRAQASSWTRYRDKLVIDKDDLDTCLVEQPELYYHVTEAHVMAVAERDAAKLTLEEAEAGVDRDLRLEAEDNSEKITETRVQQLIRLEPKIQRMRRDLAECTTEMNQLAALKEAYQQRSYMLRELVALTISQSHDSAMSAGSTEARGRLAESNRAMSGEMRRRQRGK